MTRKNDKKTKWIGIKLPEDIVLIMDLIIDEGVLGYRNRTDFTVDSLRRRYEQIEILMKNEKRILNCKEKEDD